MGITDCGPHSCPSECTTTFVPRSQFPQAASSQWLSMMKIQMCSVPKKHKTPSMANLARGLPFGLAEPLWEPRCSLRLLPPNLPTPLLPQESDLCFHLKALSAFSCSPFLCPSQLLPSLAHLTPSWHLLLGGPKQTMTLIFMLSPKTKSRKPVGKIMQGLE